ncbi:hypothetical protein E2562_034920 [Oryza meyeriana var. granulata]|uniref:Uncharacterized protein n=1 Tax=Oryza meyeriana var. granulata TaxID=110450 RepID=A0A6G1F1G3_9ORYZ|nr:hypothetical protein E2562_034920 [Oryza meyeriana var. granulata]
MRRGSPWYDSSFFHPRSKRAQLVVVSAAGKKLPWPSPRRPGKGNHVVVVSGLFFLFRFVAPLLPDPV